LDKTLIKLNWYCFSIRRNR